MTRNPLYVLESGPGWKCGGHSDKLDDVGKEARNLGNQVDADEDSIAAQRKSRMSREKSRQLGESEEAETQNDASLSLIEGAKV